jgi:hypothetical protein
MIFNDSAILINDAMRMFVIGLFIGKFKEKPSRIYQATVNTFSAAKFH